MPKYSGARARAAAREVPVSPLAKPMVTARPMNGSMLALYADSREKARHAAAAAPAAGATLAVVPESPTLSNAAVRMLAQRKAGGVDHVERTDGTLRVVQHGKRMAHAGPAKQMQRQEVPRARAMGRPVRARRASAASAAAAVGFAEGDALAAAEAAAPASAASEAEFVIPVKQLSEQKMRDYGFGVPKWSPYYRDKRMEKHLPEMHSTMAAYGAFFDPTGSDMGALDPRKQRQSALRNIREQKGRSTTDHVWESFGNRPTACNKDIAWAHEAIAGSEAALAELDAAKASAK